MGKEFEALGCTRCGNAISSGDQRCSRCGEPTIYMSFDERARRELELYKEWKARESA